MRYSERINQKSRARHPGFRRPKTLAELKFITQYRHESSENCMNSKKKEKLNPKDETKLSTKILEQFDWTDTLLTEAEKRAMENNLIEFLEFFARHRMRIGMKRDFKVKLTPKVKKCVQSRKLQVSIHLKEDLFVELALMLEFEIITKLPFSK